METLILAELAEGFLNYLRTRNREGLRSIMAEDIVWSLPGRALISGRQRELQLL